MAACIGLLRYTIAMPVPGTLLSSISAYLLLLLLFIITPQYKTAKC